MQIRHFNIRERINQPFCQPQIAISQHRNRIVLKKSSGMIENTLRKSGRIKQVPPSITTPPGVGRNGDR